MRPRARLRRAASLVVLGVLAAGCATVTPVAQPTDQVRVGMCKLATVAEEMVAASDVSPAVPCSSRHTFETYYVTSVPARVGALAKRPEPELLQAETTGACPYQPVRPYLGAGPLDSQWGISIWQKTPTPTEWRHHVRVLVCDLVVDTTVAQRAPVTRGSVRNIMRYSDSARLRQCRVGTPPANLTCNFPHTGERMGTINLDPKLKPGARDRAALAACRARVRPYTGATSVRGFRAGYTITPDGYIECWLNSTAGEVTGTQRGGLVQR